MLLDWVRNVEMRQWRNQVDEVPRGNHDPSCLLLAKIPNILLEGLRIGSIGSSELACEDVI